MAISYVGGVQGGRAGSTSTTTQSLSGTLTGGTDSSPSPGDLVVVLCAAGADTVAALNQGVFGNNNPTYNQLTFQSQLGTTYDSYHTVSYVIQGSTVDTSITIPSSGSARNAQRWVVHVFRGVDPTTPMDATATYATGTGTGRPNPAAITPTTAGAWIMAFYASAAATGSAYTAPTDFATDWLGGTTADSADCMAGAGYYTGWTSGSYDPAAITAGGTTGAADAWTATTIALRPIVDPAFSQDAFRLYADGTESGSTALANQDTNYTADVSSGDFNLGLRVRIQEDNGGAGASTDDYQLQYELNDSGTWGITEESPPSGYTTIGTNEYQIGGSTADNYFLRKFTFSNTVTISAIYAAVRGYSAGSTSDIQAIIIADPLDSTPEGEIIYSSNYQVPSSNTLKFERYTTTATATLSAGTYWIGVRGRYAPTTNLYAGYNTGGASNTTAHNTSDVSVVPTYESWDSSIYITTTNAPVTNFASTNLTDGGATTNRLGSGTGSFVAGEVSEDGLVDDLQITASNYTELLYSLTLVSSALANNDTLDFRVLRNGDVLQTAVNTYYFDGSDAAASDPNAVWTNETNADDGSTATTAQTSTTGSVSSNFILVGGTNAASSGGDISQVRARIYGNGNNIGDTANAAIYTDSLGELLGTPTQTGTGYGSYTTLSTPTGGWTWAKLQALEVKIYATVVDTNVDVAVVEIEVTSAEGYTVTPRVTVSKTTGTTLVVADMLSSVTVDNLALTQANTLAVNDATSSSTVDNLALVQQNTLVVADMLSSVTLDNTTLTVDTPLVVADLTSSVTLDATVLTQQNTLAVQDLTSSVTVDNVALTQANTLVVNDALSSVTLDNLTLTTDTPLVVQDLTSSSTLDAVTLTQQHTLSVQDLLSSSTVENTVLEADVLLVVADLLSSSTVDNITLTQQHTLAVSDLLSSSTVDNTVLTNDIPLIVQDATSSTTLDNIALTQQNTLAVQDATSSVTVDNLSLTQAHTLAVQDLTSSSTVDNVELSQSTMLTVQDATSSTAIEHPALTQANTLVVQDALSSSTVENTDLVQAHTLVVADALSDTTVSNIDLELELFLFVNDLTSSTSLENTDLTQNNVLAVQDLTSSLLFDHRSLITTVEARSYYIDSAGNIYWVLNQELGLVEKV